MRIETVKILVLKSNNGQIEGLPKNPRIIKDAKYKKLKQSLIDDPEMLELREIIAYDNHGELVVICGNMRLKALTEIGVKEVIVKILPTNTDIEKLKAFTIKDNVGFGEHDWDMLANEWEVDELEEWGISVQKTIENNIDIEPEEIEIEMAKELDFYDKFIIVKFKDQSQYEEFLINSNIPHVQTSNMDNGKDVRINFKIVFDYEDLRPVIQ